MRLLPNHPLPTKRPPFGWRRWAPAIIIGCTAASAEAGPLLGFTDNGTGGATASLGLGRAQWAVQWTQTTATQDVTLSAVLGTRVGANAGQWYVTRALGNGATAADLVASGSYVPVLDASTTSVVDFDVLERTVLGTGLSFDAGTYYLVFDGPTGRGVGDAEWVGDFASNAGVNLAQGFSLGAYYLNRTTGAAAAFQNDFTVVPDYRLVFELDGTPVPVPAPSTVSQALLGCALLRWGSRHRAGAAPVNEPQGG